jgi:hypothetical protein
LKFAHGLGAKVPSCEGRPQIHADCDVLGIQAFGFAIFANSSIDVALIVVGDAQIVMCVRKI